jgi:hypothetical protein
MNLTKREIQLFLAAHELTTFKEKHFQHACAPRPERSITSGHMEWSCSSLSEL